MYMSYIQESAFYIIIIMKMNIMSACGGLWLYRRDKGDISMKKL